MQIELKGRNVTVNDELRSYVERRFQKIANQVSEHAVLEVWLDEECNPAIAEKECVSATLHLKGITLRAADHARDLRHAINLVEEELSRQVKRTREKRRHRREARGVRAGAGGLAA